mmetsp:Transcript_47840/g.89071  ORF Transcript_47840/g.89071 Transcript_47840/m.89071 type:complete len:201 (-) Transcript_47840:208-810(-)
MPPNWFLSVASLSFRILLNLHNAARSSLLFGSSEHAFCKSPTARSRQVLPSAASSSTCAIARRYRALALSGSSPRACWQAYMATLPVWVLRAQAARLSKQATRSSRLFATSCSERSLVSSFKKRSSPCSSKYLNTDTAWPYAAVAAEKSASLKCMFPCVLNATAFSILSSNGAKRTAFTSSAGYKVSCMNCGELMNSRRL